MTKDKADRRTGRRKIKTHDVAAAFLWLMVLGIITVVTISWFNR